MELANRKNIGRWSRRALSAIAMASFIACALHAAGVVSVAFTYFPLGEVRPESGRAFIADITALDLRIDSARSERFRLLEDGREMGPASSPHALIRSSGTGHYSVWGGSLYFSASDGSSPATNGRSYVLAEPLAIPFVVVLAFAVLALTLAIPDARSAIHGGQQLSRRVRRIPFTDEHKAAAVALVLSFGLCLWQPWDRVSTQSIAAWPPAIRAAWALIALVALMIPYRETPRPIRIVLIAMSLLFGIWAFAMGLPEWRQLANAQLGPVDDFMLTYAKPIAVTTVLLSLFRPGLSVLPVILALAVWQSRNRLVEMTANSVVDFEPIAEWGLFLVFAFVLVMLLSQVARRLRLPFTLSESLILQNVFVFAIATHFGNYFFSGLQKVNLDGGAVYWVMNNPTWLLAQHARDMGAFPVHGADRLHNVIVEGFRAFNGIGNVITLSTQLAAALAVVSLPVSAAFMVVYDIWHLAVFATTGIFFWKWMILNGCCVFALRYVASPPLWFRLVMPLVVIVSPSFFSIARLGWYDSGALNLVTIEAETFSGRRVRVPSNFFGAHSFNVFANWGLATDGHPLQVRAFQSHIYGAVENVRDHDAARQCVLRPESGEPHPLPSLLALVRLSHRQALMEPDGMTKYDQFPHHVWSNPFSFSEFKMLDLRSVRRYWLVLQAICVDVADGKISSRTLLKNEMEVDIGLAR
jgi:hypothetical protein